MKLLDTNKFPLENTLDRFWHVATIANGLREFMLFVDTDTNQAYIEEITGGTLEKIEDKILWKDLVAFIEERNLNAIARQGV